MPFTITISLYSNETDKTNISSTINNGEFSNISSNNINILNDFTMPNFKIASPFVLSEEKPITKFGDYSKLFDEKYYLGLILKNLSSNKTTINLKDIYSNTFYISFNENYYNNTNDIKLTFYATTYYGTNLTNIIYSKNDFNSNVWQIDFDEQMSKDDKIINCNISFETSNDFVIIEYISLYYEIEIKNILIKNLNMGKRISSDNTSPAFGLIGQYADCRFVDKDSKILKLYQDGSLNKDYSVYFYYKDKYLGNYKNPQWSYTEDTKEINFSLEDDFEHMKSIKVEKQIYKKEKNCYEFLNEITGENYNLVLSKEVETKLKNTIIKDFYMESSSDLYTEITRICNLSQVCCIIKNIYELEFFEYV